MNHKISGYQMSLWLLAAITAPVVFFSDGNWFGVLVTGTILSAMCYLTLHFGSHWEGRIYQLLQILWLCVVLSQILPYSASCWPTATRAFPVIPLTLLSLAAIAARGGCKSTASGMSVLFWTAGILIGIIMVAGLKDLRGQYLVGKDGAPRTIFYLIFLLPATTTFIGWGEGTKRVLAVIPVLAAGVAAWIAGTISPQLADAVSWPFYEAAKGVQLLGVAKRFEALVSFGVTVGNYALYSLLLCTIRSLGDKRGKGKEAVTISALIAACLILLGIKLPLEGMVIISFALWICLPLLGVLKYRKKVGNSHN